MAQSLATVGALQSPVPTHCSKCQCGYYQQTIKTLLLLCMTPYIASIVVCFKNHAPSRLSAAVTGAFALLSQPTTQTCQYGSVTPCNVLYLCCCRVQCVSVFHYDEEIAFLLLKVLVSLFHLLLLSKLHTILTLWISAYIWTEPIVVIN